MVIDALVHQDPPRRVEGEELAANAALRNAGAHCTLLQERGGKTALLEGGEGTHGIVAEDDDRVGEVDLESGGFEGEDAGQGLAADLVAHVICCGMIAPSSGVYWAMMSARRRGREGAGA